MKASEFVQLLVDRGITQFYGVPDSLLKPLILAIDNNPDTSYTITANEGNAVGMAVGYHLATKGTAVVFMQNSGIGNAINPVMSIAHRMVYDIPMIFIIGWRGEHGIKDEPQHMAQGLTTLEMIDAMGVSCTVLSKGLRTYGDQMEEIEDALSHEWMHAFVVSKSFFEDEGRKYKDSAILEENEKYLPHREEAIKRILEVHPNAKIFATTGMIGREVYDLRDKLGQTHANDFLCVGGMGHVSSIATAYAENCPESTEIVILDGDGSFLMHMAASIYVADAMRRHRITHYILDNNSHASVGGGKTMSDKVDFSTLSTALGYQNYMCVANLSLIENRPDTLVRVKVGSSHRPDLGRPKESPIDNKNKFMGLC